VDIGQRLDPFRDHRIEIHGLGHICGFRAAKQPIAGCKQIAFFGRGDREKMTQADVIRIGVVSR